MIGLGAMPADRGYPWAVATVLDEKPALDVDSERKQTDESLRVEREKVDHALGEDPFVADEEADAVIVRARERADAVLAAARARTDRQSSSAGPEALRAKREREDAALSNERAAADEATREERAEHVRLLETERSETDKDLVIERARADAAVATRDDFLGIVSHDLRNILNAMVTFASLISTDLEHPDYADRVLAHTERIRRSGARMDRLIGDLVDVASIHAGALTVTCEVGDPAHVVSEAVDTLGARAKKVGLDLSSEVASGLPRASFDPARVLQVLTNLIGNAIKFTPSGGHIVVRVAADGDNLRFSVRDDGVGIAADKLELVFARFLQVSEDRRGVGLGLYISKCIVHGHGGRIWAESTPGGGSTFSFTLPLTPPVATVDVPAAPSALASLCLSYRHAGCDDRRVRAPRPVFALVPASIALAIAACGARDRSGEDGYSLVSGDAHTTNGAGGKASSAADAGTTSMAGGAGAPTTGFDAGTDAAPDATTALVLCAVGPVGDPVPLVSYPDSPAGAPRLVVIDPGAPGSPARVAVGTLKEQANTWHPEYRVVRARIDLPWPQGITIDQPSVVWGVDDHAWGEMTQAPGGGGLALLSNYGGELVAPVGVKFRPLDTATWTPGADVYVDQNGESPYGLAAGAGVGPLDVGYAGSGYGAAWRSEPTMIGQSQPMVAVLDTAGGVAIGPFAVAPPAQYPGRAADITWTGSAYVVSTSNGPCDAADALCVSNSVAFYRIRPASGDAVDDSGIDLITSIPVLDTATTPGRPLIGTLDGHVIAVWSEGDAIDKTVPRTVRLVRLGPKGQPVSPPVVIADGILPTTGLELSVGALGVLIGWGEAGDAAIPPKMPGNAKLVLHHTDLDGHPIQPPIAVPITQLNTFGKGMVVELVEPRGYLISWSSESEDNQPRPTWVLRLDCLKK